jgi:hypothetical protein
MHIDTSSASFLHILVLFYVSNLPGSPSLRRMLSMADRKLCLLPAVHGWHLPLHTLIGGSIHMHAVGL